MPSYLVEHINGNAIYNLKHAWTKRPGTAGSGGQELRWLRLKEEDIMGMSRSRRARIEHALGLHSDVPS